MKKIGLFFIALTFTLAIPVSSVDAADPGLNAGNGKWDNLGPRSFYYNSYYDWWDTPNVQSTGGSFRIMSDSWILSKVELWEYDPGSGNDDYVGSYTFKGAWDTHSFNHLNRFVDGSNNRAEFYVRSYNNPHGAQIYFAD
ncbi:hypothetical protein ACTWQL_08590 [Pseudalkalibacillus sp. R45]|uniref:hypothetical protein n=1 Tax=Pseudalkalibacillus sp. R45 TaxID=3457433 RepID=UPI003FCDFE5F